MEILEAREEHIDRIIPLWVALMDYHARLDPTFRRAEDAETRWREFLAKLVASDDARVFVAVEGEEIVGYCVARLIFEPPVFAEMPRGEIVDMFVREGNRRRGVGSTLLERAYAWFRGEGISRVELMVSVANPIGRPFWAKRGFSDYLHKLYRKI